MSGTKPIPCAVMVAQAIDIEKSPTFLWFAGGGWPIDCNTEHKIQTLVSSARQH